MPLISKFKDIFKGGSSHKKKKIFHNVLLDNPEDVWEIVGELGDGAYGKVYKAMHKETNLCAALKQVTLETEEDLETFMIEIDILSEFRHENVVKLIEAYHFDGKLWMYLEYCDGGAMDSIMRDLDRPLAEPQIAYVCKHLCEALVYIHENKVIHRDLKAGNVLLTMEGGVKLADFGVSAKNKNTYDKRGTFIGTPYWLAPEVILCETFIDAKYDYKADVWSLGISLIEFAQMDPPNHEVSPVRVMLKIQKSDPPKLDYPSRYSKEFNDFVGKCLVKDPMQRPTAVELLKHPFISKDLDVKPIRDLLLEYKAEVVEEEVLEDPDRTSRHSGSEHSPDDTYSINSTSTLMKDQESLNMVPIEEDKPPTYNEAMATGSGERRLSKGPAPPPPVSVSPVSTPSSSNASSLSKKGPAPAVPAVTSMSKSSAPSPENVVNDSTLPATSPTSKQAISTPGKGPAPQPMPLAESPVSKEKVAVVVATTDIPSKEDTSLSLSDRVEAGKQSSVLPETDIVIEEKMDVNESVTKEPKIKSDNKDIDEKLISDRVLLSKEEEKPSPVHISSDISNCQLMEDAEPLTPPPPFKDSSTPSSPKIVLPLVLKETQEMEVDKPVTSTVAPPEISDIEAKAFALPSPPDSSPTSPLSPLPSSASESLSEGLVQSPIVEAASDPVTHSNEASAPAPISLSPEPAEVIIASIGSDSTVIVRTPTPTPPEASKTQTPVKKESVVTYSGPAIVDENSKDEVEKAAPVEVDLESATPPQAPSSPSLSEEEEQAVRILESAIESASETTSDKSSLEDGEDVNVTLTGTSVILSPDKEVDETDNHVVDQDIVQDKDDVTEVQVIPNDGHKLDESEVVISNSSILHDETDPQAVAAEKSRYEITLEELGEGEDTRSSVTSDSDTTHISVVAVDLARSAKKQPTSPDKKCEADQHLETSSNISNMSNLSAGTPSTGRSVSSVEEENRPVALTIEGTTVGATDVDDDVFDHEQNNIKNLKGSQSPSRPVLTRETTVDSVVSVDSNDRPILTRESTIESVQSVDSVISTVSTFSTPVHSNHAPSRPSTSASNSPGTKILPNGIGRDNHRVTEKTDWDNISTTSSEKENKPRSENDENSEEVVLRRMQMSQSDKSDTSLRTVDRNRGRTKEEMEFIALRKKTRKRTRKFVIDGVVVTTTTSKVIYGDDEEMGTLSSGHLARKQELRELKLLQKTEQKQFQELAVKANFAKAEQEKKFDIEKVQLLRSYDTEVESLNRQQKQQVEKAEGQQEVELKNSSKKIRSEQERELKAFRESLKTELKLLKQEIDLLPKDKRKEAFKARKERLEVDQTEREKNFLEKLHETHEVSLKRLGDDHRERIALLERQFLQQKHQLLRSRESALWEMEERHLHEKHQLSKRQLKDIFFLQRHQMLIRHEKELEQVKRVNQQKEEELVKRQQVEKRQLPKRIRQEMKARELMFRESMRISTSHLPDSHEDEKNKLRKFQENEKRRYEAEKRRAEQKHKHKLEELQAASEATIKELEQLQNEKRKMLMEHETYKLKSQDEEYQRDVREWKDNLKPRKQKLEEEFEKQLNEQEQFYGAYLCRGLDMTPSQSTSSLARSNAS